MRVTSRRSTGNCNKVVTFALQGGSRHRDSALQGSEARWCHRGFTKSFSRMIRCTFIKPPL